MKTGLLNLLACPNCQARLELEAKTQEGNEVLAGCLRCARCSASFPIHQGIPRFVSNDAYASTFSFEWKQWRRTQFDTASRKTSERSFAASTGRRPAELAGKLVLDAGCGSGRYADLVARPGGEVVGVDH